MAGIKREEFQDKNGNVLYPHTEDSVVWSLDGRSLRENMQEVNFEDYEEGAEVPDAEAALASMAKGRSWTELFSATKAALKGIVGIANNVKESVSGTCGDAFSETVDYAVGSYCIYNNALYKFKAAHSAGAWTGDDAEVVTMTGEIRAVSENLQMLGGFTPIIDQGTGEITGYTTSIGGADTVFPFSGADHFYVYSIKPTAGWHTCKNSGNLYITINLHSSYLANYGFAINDVNVTDALASNIIFTHDNYHGVGMTYTYIHVNAGDVISWDTEYETRFFVAYIAD